MQALRLERFASRARIAALLTFLFICNGVPANGELSHGVVWYSSAGDDSVRNRAARRYRVGITGKGGSLDVDRVTIKSMNPAFHWYVYNSASDNYVTSPTGTPEHDLLSSIASARGWSVDDAYMHYWDDTVVVLQSDTLTVPGWGGGSATSPEQARIPVYYKNLSRRLVNFSSARAAQLHRETMVRLVFETPFSGSSVYPDGIFLDNGGSRLFNYGVILSGGHVREVPGRPVLGSLEYQDWHWNQNYGPFLTSLKDTLETAAGWAADGKRKYLMINVSNIWDDGYVSRDAADVIFQEFQYNAVRDFGLDMVDEAYRRDSLAATRGITSFYPATMTRSVPGGASEYSYAETMLSNLAWYLVTRTDNTLFYEMGTSVPNAAGWDSLTWRGCIDVANEQLGRAVGAPFTLASGTDPLGNSYIVKARNYERGLAVVRNRGGWDEGIEPETAVSVPLPRLLSPVDPEGGIGNPTQAITIRNGQGFFFLDEALPVELETFTAAWRPDGTALLRWSVRSASTDHAGFDVYRGTSQPEERLTSERQGGKTTYEFVDPSAPPSGSRYWLAETSLAGAVTWYGPVELASQPSIGVFLAAGEPSPFRESTTIRFGLSQGGSAILSVYDVRGREVRRLFDGQGDGRQHTVTWQGDDASGRRLSPGVYFYRLETPHRVLTRKLHLAP